jgi:CRISPR-associated protein Cmr4
MNEQYSTPQSAIRSPQSRILYLFTRTPLHVGAGASVGAIDQPIIRERHTGFPVIPATTLKGVFADEWNETAKKKRKKNDGTEEEIEIIQRSADGKWLFGETEAENAFAGALQFSEAKLLAFPIRSAKGSFAWITCPLMLRRAARDGVIPATKLDKLVEPADDKAIFDAGANSKLALGDKVVLEEYTLQTVTPGWLGLSNLGEHLASLLPADEVWKEIASRLVILSDGMIASTTKLAPLRAAHCSTRRTCQARRCSTP